MGSMIVSESPTGGSVFEALRTGRQRTIALLGQLDRNQGRPTFTGRMTLEQFTDLTVAHNRKWAADAGESMDVVTQREIIDSHANGLAAFMLEGLVRATVMRAEEDRFPESLIMSLNRIAGRLGESLHYGLPQVTLVMSGEVEVRLVKDEADNVVAARMFLPAGKLLMVADGQHRREAAKRVREFLNETIANRRTPKNARFFPAVDAPLSGEDVEAWAAVQETFRTWTLISYEAHIGLTVEEARQLFTNYNCNVKPVKTDTNLAFDQANPINRFAKEELVPRLGTEGPEPSPYDLRQLASINAFLFLGKTSIRNAPYNVDSLIPKAKQFWNLVLALPEFKREGSLLREVVVLKGLAKSWFYVHLAKRNSQSAKAERLRDYIRNTRFDPAWADSVPGLDAHTVPGESGSFRFSPAHNDIVARIVAHVLG